MTEATSQHTAERLLEEPTGQSPVRQEAGASDYESVAHPANLSEITESNGISVDACAQPVRENVQNRRGKPGAPAGNGNALVHGERSSRLPLGKPARGDEYMKSQVDAWRRELEAEAIAKYGELSKHQEAKLLTAATWELCRRRRMKLARKAADDGERALHEEAAGNDCERRDRAIEAAGIGGRPESRNGHAAANGASAALPGTLLDELDGETGGNA